MIEQQRYDEAESLLTEGLTITRGAIGNHDASIARLSFQLARVRLAHGDAAAAEALLRDALTRQLATLPPDDWITAATKSTLGGALTRLGQYDEAEQLLTDAGVVLKDVPGRQGREAAATRERLAALTEARQQSLR